MSDKKDWKKKGLLFTVMTFLLMFSIFLIALSYAERISSLKGTMISSQSLHKLRYVEDDVTSQVYNDLLGLNLSITRQGGDVVVNLTQVIIGNNTGYEQRMTFYQSFIENRYSVDNNVNINFIGFTPTITLSPINSSLTISSNATTIINISKLSQLSVVLKTNESSYQTVTENLNVGSLPVQIILLNVSNKPMYTTLSSINPSTSNSVTFDFGGGKSLRVFVGGSPLGNITVSSTMPIEILTLAPTFTTPEQLVGLGGNISYILTDNTTKHSRIILAGER